MNKKKSYRDGLCGEWVATLFLRLRGYKILERRYKTRFGEIDLIVQKGAVLAFVEVKTRADINAALESVTPKMQGRITKAAVHYVMQNPVFSNHDMRFDLIALRLPFRLIHLDNAWRPAA